LREEEDGRGKSEKKTRIENRRSRIEKARAIN
jgi:hypothetical protein